jgi:ABC-2 type transport system permease protein
MSTATGSLLWFANHDLLLLRRRIEGLFRDASGRRALWMMAGAFALFHLIGLPVANWLVAADASDPRGADIPVAAALLFVIPWIVSQALTNSTRALYVRGDLDLILSSPVSSRAVFTARAFAIALESIVSVAIFLLPIADMLACKGGARWLAIYPVLVACGLFGTAVGLVLMMTLFRVAGPRRTRVLAQVFATLVGATFAFGMQAVNLAPISLRAWVGSGARPQGSPAILDGWIGLPVRAASGDPAAVVMTLVVAAGVFALVCFLLGQAFARGIVQTADIPGTSRAKRESKRKFQPGAMGALRRKEWRLLLRDPWLASQMLLQVAYTLPLCFVLWQTLGSENGVLVAIAPAVVVIAAQLAGALAYVTLSTEDAPEFLMTAPLTRGQIERAKLSAVAIPLAIVVGLPVLAMAWQSPLMALSTLAFAIAAGGSTACLNLWRASPSRRGDLMRREGQSRVVGILEHVLSLFWAVAVAMFSAGTLWFLLPVGLALVILALNRRKG